MAINLHQPSVYALFDGMPAPLLTFGVSGAVTYANTAAKQHPGRPMEAMNGKPVIKALIADAVLGKLKLPYPAEVELEDGHRMSGQFMSGPAGLDIAFLAQTGASGHGSAPKRSGLKDVIELLRDEVGPPLKNLSRQLNALPSSPDIAHLEQASEELSQRLMRLSDLIEVFGDDIMETQDRIELQPLLQAICRAMTPRAEKIGVGFDILDPGQTLPPIYGNEKLVRRALYECLDNALVHSRKEVTSQQSLTVEIRFTLSGEHVLIGVRNRGATTLKVGGNETIEPFAKPANPAATDSVARLGLPLVQRIIGLHGGNMRLSTVDQDTVQVLMEFPTGAPQRGQAHVDMAQAQQYAKDLAQLMSRRKKEKA